MNREHAMRTSAESPGNFRDTAQGLQSCGSVMLCINSQTPNHPKIGYPAKDKEGTEGNHTLFSVCIFMNTVFMNNITEGAEGNHHYS